MRAKPPEVKIWLALDLRDQRFELLDLACSTGSRADDIALCADLLIVRLQIETAVEIEALAIAVQMGADELASAQDEVDAIGARQEGAGYRTRGKAFGAFLL